MPDGDNGTFHPPTAQHAMREGKCVARNTIAELRNDGRERAFSFRIVGQLASLGRRTGVAQIFGINFSGFIAWWLWRTIYLAKDLESVTGFFADLGIPYPALQAPFVSGVELVGGALLLAGLFTRAISVPLIIAMVVAIVTAQLANVSSLGDLFGLSELLYIALLVWIGVAGPGPLSLDALLVRWIESEDRAVAARPLVARASLSS